MMARSNPKDAPRADPHAGCSGSRGRKPPATRLGDQSRLELTPGYTGLADDGLKCANT
jgi:hypothetical protein